MTSEKVQKLNRIIRQFRDVAKDSIDSFASLAETALNVLAENEDVESTKLIQSVNQENHLLNKKQIAEFLNISERTVSDLQNEGMPTVKLGKRILFDRNDVLVWAKNRRQRKNHLRMVR